MAKDSKSAAAPDEAASHGDIAAVKTPQARRALAEADERRSHKREAKTTREINGRDGPEPVRYGDWENKGIASDF